MVRVGSFRENWGVESITPHPIAVFDDEELRRLERKYKQALKKVKVKPGVVPKPNTLHFFTPPHKKYPGDAFDRHTMEVRLVRGRYVLYRKKVTKAEKKVVGYLGIPLKPVYKWTKKTVTWERDSVIGSPPSLPPKGSKPETVMKYYERLSLWHWKYTSKTSYEAVLSQAQVYGEKYNVTVQQHHAKQVAKVRQTAQEQARIARASLQEWYLSEYRRIERSYSGDQYTGRIVRDPYGVGARSRR